MSEYLPEDQDLLDEIESIGETSTGTAWNHQLRRLNEAQIKSTLRARKTTSDMERSTSRYSIVLILFTITLIIVAIAQFVFDVINSEHIWIGIGLIVLLLFGIGYFFNILDPDELLKK